MTLRQRARDAVAALRAHVDGVGARDAMQLLQDIADDNPLPDAVDEIEVMVFTSGGKYYTLELVPWPATWNNSQADVRSSFRTAVLQHLNGRCQGMTAVCTEFPHPYSHPCSFTIPAAAA